MIVRNADLSDLPKLTEIQNYYIQQTHITFDVRPFSPEEREPWFREHSDGKRYRILVAEESVGEIAGYAATGPFRSKEAYQTTVEVSVACNPAVMGKGVGSRLYTELFVLLAREDIHSIVAGIAQPNPASNRLHEKFGFQRVGTFTEVGRKFGRYWDVMWMEKIM